MPDGGENPIAKVVEAARPLLRRAASRLTQQTEPAAIYTLEPHPLAEDVDDEETA